MKIKPLVYVVVSLVFLFLIGIDVEANVGAGSYSGSCGNVNMCNVDYTCGSDDGVCPADFGSACSNYDTGCCDPNPSSNGGNVLGCGLCCDMQQCNRCRDLNSDGLINGADAALVIATGDKQDMNGDGISGNGCDVLCVTSVPSTNPITSGYQGRLASEDALCSATVELCSNEGGACSASNGCGGTGDLIITGTYDDCTGSTPTCCDCGANRLLENGQCENMCNNNGQCEPGRGETNTNCPNDCQDLPTCAGEFIPYADGNHLGQCAPSNACDTVAGDTNKGVASGYEDCTGSTICCICGEGRRWDTTAGECAPIPLDCSQFNCPALTTANNPISSYQSFRAWDAQFGNSGACSTTCSCANVPDTTSITYTYHYYVDSSASSGDMFTIGGDEPTHGGFQTFTKTGTAQSISFTSDSTGSFADGNEQWRGVKVLGIACNTDCNEPQWECGSYDSCAEVSPGNWEVECKSVVNSAPDIQCAGTAPAVSDFDYACTPPCSWTCEDYGQCTNGERTRTCTEDNGRAVQCAATKPSTKSNVGCGCGTICNDLYGSAIVGYTCSTDSLTTQCFPGVSPSKALELSYQEIPNAFCTNVAESCFCALSNTCDYSSCNNEGTLCGGIPQCSWDCGEWVEGTCSAGWTSETRTCTETAGCGNLDGRPALTRSLPCPDTNPGTCNLNCDQPLTIGKNTINDVSVWHNEYGNNINLNDCTNTCSCPATTSYMKVDYEVNKEGSDIFRIDGSALTSNGEKTISNKNSFEVSFTSDSSGSYLDGGEGIWDGVRITDIECLDCSKPVYANCQQPASCPSGSTYTCPDTTGCGFAPDVRDCEVTPPNCDTACGTWSNTCNPDQEQTRDCSSAPSCPTTRPVPVEWDCGEWGDCEVDLSSPTDGYQYRTCTDLSACQQTPPIELTRQTADCKVGSCSAFDTCPSLSLGFNNVAIGVYQESFGRYGNQLYDTAPNPPQQCRLRTGGTDSCSCPAGTTYMAITYTSDLETNDGFFIDDVERSGSDTLTLNGRTHSFRFRSEASGSYIDGGRELGLWDGALITQITCLTDTPTFGDPGVDDTPVDDGQGIDEPLGEPDEVIVGVELV